MFDFYRIEKNGVGPYIYSDENDFHWMEYNHHDCEFTPPIDDDQGFSVNEHFIYNYNARKKM